MSNLLQATCDNAPTTFVTSNRHVFVGMQLNYLSETNGEQHLWLHNWVADNPIPLSGEGDTC